MLELVFVIVILGIVASIGSSLIVQVYESYIVQRALHRTSAKAELAAMQISNRLTYRISSSAIGRKLPTGTPPNKYLPLDQVPDDDYKILEWIGYDNDSFSAQSTPGWSGFCDVNVSSRTAISTPGSNLDDATNGAIAIIAHLDGNIADAAIVFAGHEYSPTKNYIANCMGFSDYTCITPISGVGTTSITIEDNNPGSKVITDQYKLVWSAYAVVPTQVTGSNLTDRGFDSGATIYDLALHYNYQPWDTNSSSSYADGSSSPLVTNVESFRFIGKGDTIRFKICVIESIGDANITSCKEKAVIR